ncbi:putative membrane protein [Arcobacter venerupis]|uniref:Membrane protein n=1 Tax=Arcobacter venerupis TaxID=1054033 RepID=A0AAE7BBH3_9BACT|nr:hypothetical protein [Arcobacter venerupis]QKF67175.1 putative membrane protein [Arcobacter venerupis]RWS48388.1 hypothetical protein CKA56_14195 [Arcobacter venerupis]
MSVLISLLTNLIPTIVTFFANMAKKLTLTAIIVPIQITLLIALYTAKFAFITTIITLIVWIYNRVVVIFGLISSMNNNVSFDIPFKILQSLGIFQALNETFALFSYVFVSLMILFISKLAIMSLQSIADEYFKIGVLLQLGLK